jgi:hypothetical protein
MTYILFLTIYKDEIYVDKTLKILEYLKTHLQNNNSLVHKLLIGFGSKQFKIFNMGFKDLFLILKI